MLRASRARAEAYSRDLADWEVQTARARNEGTFFKGLFKADVLQRPEGDTAASLPSSTQVGMSRDSSQASGQLCMNSSKDLHVYA